MNAQRRAKQIERWQEQQIRLHQLAAFKRNYWQFLLFMVVYTFIIVEMTN